MLFFESEFFRKRVAAYLSDEAYAALQSELIAAPDKGDLIREAGGARKIRVPLHGRGKGGGGRVVYYHKVSRFAIVFLDIYAKNEKVDLVHDDIRRLREEVAMLKEEGYP